MSIRVVLIRHGESSYNVDKRIQGRSDLPFLTTQGSEQANCTQIALQEIPINYAYCSPLQRAKATTEVLLANRSSIPFTSTPLLLEVDIDEWLGLTFDQVNETYPDDYHLWRTAPDHLQFNGRYPIRNLWTQAKDFWTFLRQQHPELIHHRFTDPCVTILVVGHSGINRALISTALGIPANYYHGLGQENCAISILNFCHGLGHSAQLESLNNTAHLGSPLPKQKGGIRFLLVRHGETQWNREQRFQGQMDIPLNMTGQVQAQQVADFLKIYPIHQAFSSPLKRSWETAQSICQTQSSSVEMIPIPKLQEISHGSWEGKLQSEIEQEYVGQLALWQSHPEQVQMPEGENLNQVWARSKEGWTEILSLVEGSGSETVEKTILVVAHDAINKALLCLLFNLDPSSFWVFKQGNGGVSVIDYPNGSQGSPVLKVSNLTAYLSGGILDCTAAGAL